MPTYLIEGSVSDEFSLSNCLMFLHVTDANTGKSKQCCKLYWRHSANTTTIRCLEWSRLYRMVTEFGICQNFGQN